MASAFQPEDRLRLVAAWLASGVSAAKFAAGHPGLTATLLHNWNWRKKLAGTGEARAAAATVHLAVELDIATYAPMAKAAADLSLRTGRHVTVEEYAAATLRHLLTGAAKAGKVRKAGNPPKEQDETEERSGRGPKGRGGRARRRGGGRQQVAGGAARRAGPSVRKGSRRRPRKGAPPGRPGRKDDPPWDFVHPGPSAHSVLGPVSALDHPELGDAY